METSTEKQLPVSSNLMEEKSAHVPPENILNEELETLTTSILHGFRTNT